MINPSFDGEGGGHNVPSGLLLNCYILKLIEINEKFSYTYKTQIEVMARILTPQACTKKQSLKKLNQI